MDVDLYCKGRANETSPKNLSQNHAGRPAGTGWFSDLTDVQTT